MPETYHTILHELSSADTTTELPDHEEWEAMIQRINTPCAIHQISKETYWYFLEVLPPKWIDHQGFAFAEGEEPLKIFQERGENYSVRNLTWEETHRVLAARRAMRQAASGE